MGASQPLESNGREAVAFGSITGVRGCHFPFSGGGGLGSLSPCPSPCPGISSPPGGEPHNGQAKLWAAQAPAVVQQTHPGGTITAGSLMGTLRHNDRRTQRPRHSALQCTQVCGPMPHPAGNRPQSEVGVEGPPRPHVPSPHIPSGVGCFCPQQRGSGAPLWAGRDLDPEAGFWGPPATCTRTPRVLPLPTAGNRALIGASFAG